jgi:hypothetical protein
MSDEVHAHVQVGDTVTVTPIKQIAIISGESALGASRPGFAINGHHYAYQEPEDPIASSMTLILVAAIETVRDEAVEQLAARAVANSIPQDGDAIIEWLDGVLDRAMERLKAAG